MANGDISKARNLYLPLRPCHLQNGVDKGASPSMILAALSTTCQVANISTLDLIQRPSLDYIQPPSVCYFGDTLYLCLYHVVLQAKTSNTLRTRTSSTPLKPLARFASEVAAAPRASESESDSADVWHWATARTRQFWQRNAVSTRLYNRRAVHISARLFHCSGSPSPRINWHFSGSGRSNDVHINSNSVPSSKSKHHHRSPKHQPTPTPQALTPAFPFQSHQQPGIHNDNL